MERRFHMSKDIVQVFDNSQFGSLRVVKDEHGEPWFVATDLAKTLGYRDAEKITRRLADDEKATQLVCTLGGEQSLSVVNESGLYRSILARHSGWVKDAEKRNFINGFQRWVTHEVLPAIRKDGGYMVARKDETPEETMARAVLIAQATIERQSKQIEEMRPKAVFADAVSVSSSTILVGDLAKLLKQNGVEIGGNRLFALLREQGFLCKQKGAMWNMPTQRSMDMGLFEVKETAVTHSDGHVTINKTPKVTGKGQVYFVNRFCKAKTDA